MSTAQAVNYLAVEGPHGTTFPTVKSRAEAEKYLLTPAQLESYRTNGFVHDVSIMNKEQVDRLRDGLEAIVNGRARTAELISADKMGGTTDEKDKLTYMQGAWMIDEAIHDLVFHPAITVKLTQLLKTPRVRFWHDQVFYKPARTGSNVAWHQDYSYWQRSTPAQHITVWIGLDDSREDNGCLRAVPGSHKWPLLDATSLTGEMAGLEKQLTKEQRDNFKPVPLEQPCGSCSFHHDHTVHGSFANRSERPRRAIVLNYMADGTISGAADGVMMPGFKPIPKGQKIEGDWFPLVIDMERLK
jgi:hypothetical protein